MLRREALLDATAGHCHRPVAAAAAVPAGEQARWEELAMELGCPVRTTWGRGSVNTVKFVR
jgi:hypothetical protein